MCLAVAADAQAPEQLDLTAVGKNPQWKISNRTASVVDVKGKRALKLSEGEGMGIAWLDGYDFAKGVIDVDILGRSQPIQGSFVGIAFRVLDAKVHDAVYFRPFNFRDRSRASQSCRAICFRSKVALAEIAVGTSGRVRTRGDPRTRWRSMVSRPYSCRAAQSERLREWRNGTLPRCQRAGRPYERITRALGWGGFGRILRELACDAVAVGHRISIAGPIGLISYHWLNHGFLKG